MQTKSTSNIKGIDVSHHNVDSGPINWSKVKADGVQFVYIKASEGTTYTDPQFAASLNNAKAVGLLVGAYHFARPEKGNPIGEAKNFVNQLHSQAYDLMPVLDLESPTDTSLCTKANLIQFVKTFVDYVEKETGRKVMMYTGNWFVDMYGGLDESFKDMPLWIANYGNIQAPPNSGGWTEWTVWQYNDKGVVNGIVGNVDMNVAVSLEALYADINPQYEVHQYGLKLGDYRTLADAQAEAAKWDHSYVKRITDGVVVSHNFASDEQLNGFLAVPEYAKSVVSKLIGAGALENPSGDETFYRILCVLDRVKLFG